MSAFPGFPAISAMRWVPVPGVVLGALLAEIDDVDELRLLLRVLALLREKSAFPRAIARGELESDAVLVRGLRLTQDSGALDRALAACVRRGTLLAIGEGSNQQVLLNAPAERRIARRLALAVPAIREAPPADALDLQPSGERPSIFSLYEENVGPVTPLLAEELGEAADTYPAAWIEDAFREAVARNRRSWRYIRRILERWHQEGRPNGEHGRDPQADRSIERYTRGRYGHVVRY